MQLVWYSCPQFFSFFIRCLNSKLSKQIEQLSSSASPRVIHNFSGTLLIWAGVRPLLTFPFASSSSRSYSYVMLSVLGLFGSWGACYLLSSMALWSSLSSSASALPIMLFIITCIIISFSLCRASWCYRWMAIMCSRISLSCSTFFFESSSRFALFLLLTWSCSSWF